MTMLQGYARKTTTIEFFYCVIGVTHSSDAKNFLSSQLVAEDTMTL